MIGSVPIVDHAAASAALAGVAGVDKQMKNGEGRLLSYAFLTAKAA